MSGYPCPFSQLRSENILAKWNGTEWKQINKQPTAEELKTLLGLGTAAYTDASAYDAAGSAKAVRDYVGEIPETATAKDILLMFLNGTKKIFTDEFLMQVQNRDNIFSYLHLYLYLALYYFRSSKFLIYLFVLFLPFLQ